MQFPAAAALRVRARVAGLDSAALALCGLSGVVLLCALYRTTFQWWWYEWTTPGSYYAQALFVPFFCAAMIVRNRAQIAARPWRPSASGLLLASLSLALFLLADRAGVATIRSVSFILLVVAVSLLIAGVARTRVILFALVFTVLMIPLVPDQLINLVAFPIQIASAKMATAVLNIFLLHAVRQGAIIRMDSYQMGVELPCSGFKTLVSLLTFSAAFCYVLEAAAWKRWLLFALTTPLSLFINALRITLIGMVGELVSGEAAATFHDWSGLIVLTLGFVFLYNLARLVGAGLPAISTFTGKEAHPASAVTRPLLPLKPLIVNLIGLDLLLGIALAARGSIAPAVHLQQVVSNSQAPAVLRGAGVVWKADRSDPMYDALPKAVQDELRPSRVINRNYMGSDGSRIQFFLTAGNGRKVFHDPHTCSLGSDATLTDRAIVSVPTALGTLRVQESAFRRAGDPNQYEVLFFYVVEGRIVQRTEQVRNQLILQMLLGDRGMPSYFFRVVQGIPGIDGARRGEATRFIAAMWNKIGGILTAPPGRFTAVAPNPHSS
ncbi:MAG TPA: exosortase/archaeosortase family protein [Chthonomonadales bacterium]|nr:exosortase/archaeosortase family protein [Chthonomonadales bacterium]